LCRKHRGYITFMCRPAILPMMKRGNDAIGSCHWVKSKLPFCIQIMWQKCSTFLAIVIVTPSYRFAQKGLPKRSFIFLKNPYNLLAVYELILIHCIIARMSSFSGQCERLSRRLVYIYSRSFKFGPEIFRVRSFWFV
jgi:hypothetical protein